MLSEVSPIKYDGDTCKNGMRGPEGVGGLGRGLEIPHCYRPVREAI